MGKPRRVWLDRADNYSGHRQARLRAADGERKIEMFYIGG